MPSPVLQIMRPAAKWSACLVLVTVILATPSLLIVSCFSIAAFCLYRLSQLPKLRRQRDIWLFEQYPDLDPPDKRWLIAQEKLWRHK